MVSMVSLISFFFPSLFSLLLIRQGDRDGREATGLDPANRFLVGCGEGRQESEEEEPQGGGGGSSSASLAVAGAGGEPTPRQSRTLRHHRPDKHGRYRFWLLKFRV